MISARSQLRCAPFQVTPDPGFIYWTEQHRRAARQLKAGLALEAPISVLTGEVGTGKTTVLRVLLEDCAQDIRFGLLSNFNGELGSVPRWARFAFDIRGELDRDAETAALEQLLKQEQARGRRCVLVVDEAQNVPDAQFDAFRQLTRMNSGAGFLLLLAGQPGLQKRLRAAGNAAFARHVDVQCHLGPMREVETAGYVRHRLSVAGASGELFDEAALTVIHRSSRGIPRVINVICSALMEESSGAAEADRIGADRVRSVIGRDGPLAHLVTDLDVARSRSDRKPVIPEPVAPERTEAPAPVRPDREVSLVHAFYEQTDVFVFNTTSRHVDAPAEKGGDRGAAHRPAETVLRRRVERVAAEQADAGTASEVAEPASAAPVQEMEIGPRDLTAPPPRRRGKSVLRGGLTGTAAAAILLASYSVLNVPTDRAVSSSNAQGGEIARSGLSSPAILSSMANIRLPSTVPTREDVSGDVLLDRAIEAGLSDPAAAALNYARAALRGEDRAAYYLGQLYETGDGVVRDPALARSWYASVEDSVRGARRRLAALDGLADAGTLAVPQPVMGGLLDDGSAEFVWIGGKGASGAYFVVEVTDGTPGRVRRLAPVEVSAQRVDGIGEAKLWRVFAVDASTGDYTVSDWVPLGQAEGAAQAGPVLPEIVVRLPRALPEDQRAAVTDALEAAELAFRVEEMADAGMEGLRVTYFLDPDAELARTVAMLFPGTLPVQVVKGDIADGARPVPGKLLITTDGADGAASARD